MENTKPIIEEENKNSEIAGSDNCSNVTNISSLPDDIMVQILVRVPEQDIYGICSSWHKITRTRPEYDQLVFVSTQKDQIEISNFDDHKFTAREILSSCNGLVLDYNKYDRSDPHISNPVTKRRIALPPLDPLYGYAAMAYAAASMEYKVVNITCRPGNVRPCCSILTVGVDKDWTRRVNIKDLSHTEVTLLFVVRPLTTEGFLHWARHNYSHYVLTLNVETEIITLHHLPPPLRGYSDKKLVNYYLSTGRHLSILISDRTRFSWEVWMMKSETGEWTNVTRIDLEVEKCMQLEGVSALNCRLEPVGWSKHGEVLVFRVSKLKLDHNSEYSQSGYYHFDSTRYCIAYNVCTREMNSFELECHTSNNYIAHRNSLVWLDRVPLFDEVGEAH
ncbi:hypothetical protein CASFOL_015801 [Castilleja foliolosa]|uniref:F-box associated beta-propeller type 3 domain-containing protein n=1 Tax=Castilleja foliolosa TaxID=1961234 RepID=A0ABD3DFD7_9LAMI